MSIYGGDEKSRYSIQGNYFDQQGTLIATNFKRYSARFNYAKNFTSKLKLATSILGSNSDENKLRGFAYNDNGFSSAFASLFISNPLQTKKNGEGSYNATLQAALSSTINTVGGQQYTDDAILGINFTGESSVVIGKLNLNNKRLFNYNFKISI